MTLDFFLTCECGHEKEDHNLIYIYPHQMDNVGMCNSCECLDFSWGGAYSEKERQ